MEYNPNTTEDSSTRTIFKSDTAAEVTQPLSLVHQQSKVSQVRPGKRLIVACDGTWLDSDDGYERDSYLPWKTSNGELAVPSNVTRISRALKPQTSDGQIPQIIYYHGGIGSENNWYSHFIQGITGQSISQHIREGYAFIVNNYQLGDEIFLLGFSRGAFTARSIAGLISAVGLLTKRGMSYFYEIFKDWENQTTKSYKSKWPDKPFPNRPSVTDPRYATELEERGLSRTSIPIKAVAVWDTVGSLGIPKIGLYSPATTTAVTSEYSFVDTVVPPNVEYAFQALALDEHRRAFTPSIWEKSPLQVLPRVLKQTWFPGVHSNIGGSYDDQEMADVTLAWMMQQLGGLLEFDRDYLAWMVELNKKYYKDNRQPVRTYGTGKIYNSMVGIQRLVSQVVRTPGHYCTTPTDPDNKASPRQLLNTGEFFHPSVRIRIQQGGKGTDDVGLYKPAALKDWALMKNDNGKWEWSYVGTTAMSGYNILLPEDELEGIEAYLYELTQ